ncbi:hypothetical protein HCG46_15245 [Labrenzia sp. PO1]|uniref:hypothetical protein n=1 Tax=Labrenzia sp. PO1 TaxID=2720390 RepID=UPI0014475027|nr:hypothetical protein [Labrenzia sp. PO1]NKI59628.1 hypothetical protein [Labrenzia sp. PO1]
MTAVIIPFIPKESRPSETSPDCKSAATSVAQRNMADFIAHQKKHGHFMTAYEIDWADTTWTFDRTRGKTGVIRTNFVTEPNGNEPFSEPFLDQAKAVLCELFRKNPKVEPQKILRALRTIYKALLAGGKPPDLVFVEQLLIDGLGDYIEQSEPGGWWSQGRHMNIVINSVLSEFALTGFEISYHSPYKWRELQNRENLLIRDMQSADFKEKNERLPDIEAIIDIASLFNRHGGPYHIYNMIYSGFVALGMFAPSRQSEITTLPVDCITSSVDEIAGSTRMGLSWRPAKNGQPITKFAVGKGQNPEWEAVASEAVQRLKAIGSSARRAAKWYAENPNKLYMPPDTEHLRGHPLTWLEVAEILDWDPIDKPLFRDAFRMMRALEQVGTTHDKNRMGELKKNIQEVGHAATYTYKSVVALAKKRVNATKAKQGPNNTRMKNWFLANPDHLLMPEDLKHLNGEPLTKKEIVRLLNEYSDFPHPMKALDQRNAKLLRQHGTTTDQARVERKTIDTSAKSNRSRSTFSQKSIDRYLRSFIAAYIGPLPDHLIPMAKWFKEHSDQPYLTDELQHLRDEPLTLSEALSLINVTENDLVKPNSIRYITSDELDQVGRTKDPNRLGRLDVRSLATYSFDSLEKFVLRKFQIEFPVIDPETKLHFSQALFCLGYNSQIADKATIWNVPFWVNYNSIIHALSGQHREGQKALTIFSRNKLLNPATGKPWKLTTHQLRHLLNTLAQGKYLSQALIAFWSGRKSVSQNSFYDHVPQEAIIESWQLMDEKSGVDIKVTGPLADKAKDRSINEAITYDEALKLELGAIHVTSKGLCRHNFALTPCPKDKNCEECGENMIVAHDERHIREAERSIAMHQNALKHSLNAKQEGEPGVDRWIEKHKRKLARWDMIHYLITDQDTPSGTIISLPPPEHDQSKAGLIMDEVAASATLHPTSNADDKDVPFTLDMKTMFDGD